MAYRVQLTSECLDELDGRWEWFRDHVSVEHAARFYRAARTAAAKLADMPSGRPLCLDKAVQGRGLREEYFGAGGKRTHRLIFRVVGQEVEVVTVRSFAQDDLTPADL